MQNDTFNKNGRHFLEQYRQKLRIEMKINFQKGIVDIHIIYPAKIKEEENKKNNPKLFLETEQKNILSEKFNISNDYTSVKINNLTYVIPDFFNKEMIKNKDISTWKRIFYQIFSDKIFQKLKCEQVSRKKKDKEKKDNNEILNTSK